MIIKRGEFLKSDAEYLFEVSSEVCNKVGGIYTVIKSKINLMKKYYKNYILFGPYYEDKAKLEFQEQEFPEWLNRANSVLLSKGIKCHYGEWLVEGRPKVILVDYFDFWKKSGAEVKKNLWEWYQIDSLFIGDFETLMMWSSAVGIVISEIVKYLDSNKIVAHFHEFLSGPGLLYVKKLSSVKTVFTTHATILGRAIAGSGIDLYQSLDSIDPYQESKRLGVLDKYTAEKASALNADIFTTVSEITSIEAEKLLGRKPDVLVLNGLDISKFPTFEETSISHREYRDKIREFISYYFYPYYTFDVDNTIIFFVVGRYEYKNKGIDILTKALGKLNEKLKSENSDKTVVALYWIPSGTYGIRKEVLENKDFYRHIKHSVERHLNKIENTIISELISGVNPQEMRLFNEDFGLELKKQIVFFKKDSLPPYSTHYIDNEDNDAIIKGFRENGLLNRKEDRVKVIDYPIYLSGADGLIDLNYYDAIMGSHLGIFPSYYEPWGYTPLETSALGVPAITTDLAGFGRFISKLSDTLNGGIYVLKRYKKSDEEVVNSLTTMLYNYLCLHQKDRVAQKLASKRLSEFADWNDLIKNYVKAHNLALLK